MPIIFFEAAAEFSAAGAANVEEESKREPMTDAATAPAVVFKKSRREQSGEGTLMPRCWNEGGRAQNTFRSAALGRLPAPSRRLVKLVPEAGIEPATKGL